MSGDSSRGPAGVRVGVVLAGGEARRMGRDKRLLRLGDATLLERNLAFLHGLFPIVGLSLRSASQAPDRLPAGVEVVPDLVPGSPLGGLASILARYREPVFALAADVAFPDRGAVARVVAAFDDVDVALPVAEDHLEPLHAVYGPGCLPHIERLLAAGAHSILDLFPLVRVAEIPFATSSPFFNVNTPADWGEARRRAGGGQAGGGPAVLAVVGRPGSGKTTLIERLIPELVALGLRVATIKDTARFDFDVPGKDSWRHGRTGAEAYAVASATQLAYVRELREPPPLAELVARYFPGCDLVICEGCREEAPHTIEVFRRDAGHVGPLCDPERVLAVVTDADLERAHRFGLDDTAALARFLTSRLGLPGGR
jgi:molybdopterin-guanine dinucleotide biosynthesis protein MobB